MPLQRARTLVRWFVRPLSEPERSFWRVVTSCLLAAVTLWLLNALNKTYTTRISYPVQWSYDASRYIPVRPLEQGVAVQVTGRGWKLLRNALGFDVRPAEVLVRRLPISRSLPGTALRPVLISTMEGLQLNAILTDTLYFEFDRLAERRLPLRLSPAADGSALAFAARFAPESITFRGPATTLNALPSPYPVHLPQAPAGSSDGSIIVPIGGPALVETDVAQVKVKLQPRPLLTRVVRVKPELRNFPAGLAFRLKPATVPVQVQYFPEDSSRLALAEVRVLVDFRQLHQSDSMLQPVLMPLPATVRGAQVLAPRVRLVAAPTPPVSL
ncbi:hypothetical protein F0P96_13650 [Hymenobacter busanensis]|uniref:Uncharacterized protein n=1 Tax=Hymenobacter busanensis TaxID=2607656 RepID=A0A7L4ZZS9_9BACT|nr:hypothetical protein [Hymenobacter busanensis]KAA9331292.1 hypothetical protein F0P96_13650 [Hymenobacter busanensis]QHJ08443.1 hypothetical protein GUY19_14575 [Hymenobacter busanensis]